MRCIRKKNPSNMPKALQLSKPPLRSTENDPHLLLPFLHTRLNLSLLFAPS